MLDETIDGLRVVLTPLLVADAAALAGLLAEPDLRRWLRADDIADLRTRFAAWEARRSPDGSELWLNWAVRARDGGRVLGWVQATVRGDAAVVGYATLPRERGAGAAGDALRALTGWLRERLDVASITAAIADANTASARVAGAAGFVRTGRRAGGEAVWSLAQPGGADGA